MSAHKPPPSAAQSEHPIPKHAAGSRPASPPPALNNSTLAFTLLSAQSETLADVARWIAGPGAAAFDRAVELIVACSQSGGSVLISGLGKSGLVGAKVAATLSSLGITAHAVHPSEAAHGDLGRFRPQDTVICLSKSGETDEVVSLAGVLRQDGLPIISITTAATDRPQTGARPPTPLSPASKEPERRASDCSTDHRSSLERLATVALIIPLDQEAGGPRFVAPTSSTTATMALGDALALAAAARLEFTDADFRRRHPGGALGGLLRPLVEILRFRAGGNLPLVPEGVTVGEALRLADQTQRRPGALVIIDASRRLTGIFTDGDLRRLIGRDPSGLSKPIEAVMTRTPRTLPADALVRDAVNMVREFRQDEIPVVGPAGEPVGILDVQDLIAMRLVKD